MGTAFIRGLQGNDRRFLKTSACAKHFAVYSGPESGRHAFNALVDEKDLRETYLYAFKKLVDAGVESIMCAYNRVNDEPCCTGTTLLRTILRNEWNFHGQVVTDCWALEDIWSRHKVMSSSVEVTVAAVKAGVNLDCSNMLQDDVVKAIQQNLLAERDVDSALAPTLRTQCKLGLYDTPPRNPYAEYGADSVANGYHVALARRMAQESMVLLKNNNVLPLDTKKYQSMMIVGPNAASLDALVGNYHGVSDKAVNFVEGISGAVDAATRVEYDQGCDFTDTVHFGGTWAAGNADVTVAVIGLTPVLEGEEGDAFLSPEGGDRKDLRLPASHIAYMRSLRRAHEKPVVAVITAGSAVDVAAIEPYADAILYAWYSGEQGGNALADILFGRVSPSGRLPVTLYSSVDDLPPFDSYAMQGRTYRYYGGKVQYPFGFGLSYTSFTYAWVREPALAGDLKDEVSFSVKLTNTGNYDGDAVVQAYVEYPPVERMPRRELKAFKRLAIPKGNASEAGLRIPVSELQKWDLQQHQWTLYPGVYTICIGRSAQDIVLRKKITLR
jgi:beta-glucosidase